MLDDLYYRMIRKPWSYLLSLAFAFYALVNLLFGTLYFLFREGLHPAGATFRDCYFFSVHTFSTVGYGSIYPLSLPVHVITVVEIFCGLVSMALFTGLCFAKFSRPTARFLFSQNLLVTQHQGRRALLIRVANARTNSVMDAEMSLTVLHDEMTPEGISYRRLEDLPLERARTPVFVLSMTCAHFFTLESRTARFLERLANGENIEFLVSVRGLDETFGQTIHDTQVYRPASVLHDRQFEDILELRPDGTRVIDFAKFQKLKS